MNKQTIIIASVVNRLFLVLMIGLFIILKQGSMTGFDYVPVSFYVMLFMPLLFIIILTWYQLCNPARIQRKAVLRIISLVILAIVIVAQSIACYSVITSWILQRLMPILLGPLLIFLLASVFTWLGVYRKLI